MLKVFYFTNFSPPIPLSTVTYTASVRAILLDNSDESSEYSSVNLLGVGGLEETEDPVPFYFTSRVLFIVLEL